MLENDETNLRKRRSLRPSSREQLAYPYIDKLRGRFPLLTEGRILEVYHMFGTDTSFDTLIHKIECGMEASRYLIERLLGAETSFSEEWLTTKGFQFGGLTLIEILHVIEVYKTCDDPFVLKVQNISVLRALQKWKESRTISPNK